MIDLSTSMVDSEADGVTRWELVRDGVVGFVGSSALTGLDVRVGVQFFTWLADESCDVGNFTGAAQDLGPLSTVAEGIVSAFEAQSPGGLTPTYPALSGAITYAKTWAKLDPDAYTAVVFITDGYPTRCDPQDIPSIAALATAAHDESPRVDVHVMGIDGVYNLDPLAAAGGTQNAHLVENQGDPAVVTNLLVSIATAPLGS